MYIVEDIFYKVRMGDHQLFIRSKQILFVFKIYGKGLFFEKFLKLKYSGEKFSPGRTE